MPDGSEFRLAMIRNNGTFFEEEAPTVDAIVAWLMGRDDAADQVVERLTSPVVTLTSPRLDEIRENARRAEECGWDYVDVRDSSHLLLQLDHLMVEMDRLRNERDEVSAAARLVLNSYGEAQALPAHADRLREVLASYPRPAEES